MAKYPFAASILYKAHKGSGDEKAPKYKCHLDQCQNCNGLGRRGHRTHGEVNYFAGECDSGFMSL